MTCKIQRTEITMLTGEHDPIDSHEFTSREDAERWLRDAVPNLTGGHIEEIFANANTTFTTQEMINRYEAAYWGAVEYQIDVA